MVKLFNPTRPCGYVRIKYKVPESPALPIKEREKEKRGTVKSIMSISYPPIPCLKFLVINQVGKLLIHTPKH